ncbi:hypothetical protein [Lonsdalea britannica]|uniref:hypothetical protein n=1 Tax=Lonsdalea britannica TaxID=1082704 RepID=UPI001594E2D7|nr:hypothetical protein [Lonsdalea britannica]
MNKPSANAGKTARVTGASHGIGQDIARVMAFPSGEDRGWINVQVVRANGGFA